LLFDYSLLRRDNPGSFPGEELIISPGVIDVLKHPSGKESYS
jgi:hypothetical protein